jgi:mono/diheme cytochrome c family protein
MKILKAFLPALLIVLVVVAMGVGVLIHRGFRATATPLPLEAALARRVRNLAIPTGERRQKNPLEATSEARQQGREYFMNQCAACHGIDGSAKTQVGLNLYPKVPDLRALATQNLSDGEIHYIIENGVQFTGMPAWGNPHTESSATVGNLFSSFEVLARGPVKKGCNRRRARSRRTMLAHKYAKDATRRSMSAGRRRQWRT